MKTKILVLSIALVLSANLRAQVTIGELVEPTSGAILDLNKAIKGGLALSNVKIEHLYEIPVGFPGISTPGDVTAQVKQEFTGAMVYHTGENNIAAGIYVWNGTNWAPVKENCLPLSESNLTLTAPFFAQVNKDLSFSASANTSEICSGGETYSWSVTPAATVQSPSAANTSIKFTATGTYKVKVKVGNRYTDPATTVPAEKEKTVIVTTDGSLPTNLLSNTYGLVGAACLDVKKSKQPASQSDAAYAARIDAFAGGYEKTYKFIHGDTYSDLSLSYEDDPNAALIKQIIPPAVTGSGSGEATFTVTFKPDVKNLAPANGDSLTVKLLASYKDSGGIDKLSYLEIRVEDGTCVCPAKINATQWLNFACHNLGGEDILSSSQLITQAHHGDWYRWGAAVPSVQNLNATTDATPSTSEWIYNNNDPAIPEYQDYTTHSTADWYAAKNPCPAGWRLPTNPELAAAINKTASNGDLSTDNNTLASLGTWSTSSTDKTNFSALLKVGDYLYLPAAGYRYNSDGSLIYRGSAGYYWSSSAQSSGGWCAYFNSGSRDVANANRAYGFSVRCVAAE